MKDVFAVQDELGVLHPIIKEKNLTKKVLKSIEDGIYTLDKFVPVDYIEGTEKKGSYIMLLEEFKENYITISMTVLSQLNSFIASGLTIEDINSQVNKIEIKSKLSEKNNNQYKIINFVQE